jgi:DNA-binding response OmpR family regulator
LPPVLRRSTVLVVEDDPNLRDLYRMALTSAGYVVVAVEDGLDALRRLDDRAPNAVVLDLALPRVGGRDVHREMRARPHTRNVPVVIVSGTDVDDLNPADFASVLRKPALPDAVVAAVDWSLRKVRTGFSGW